MDGHATRSISAAHPAAEVHSDAQLYGWALALARAAWSVLVAVPLGLFIFAVPAHFALLRQTAMQAQRALQRTPHGANLAWAQALLAVDFYPAFVLTLEIALTATFALAALAIFSRRSANWMAIFASITLVNFAAIATPALSALVAAHPVWRFPVDFVQAVGLECELLIFYLTPTGRFVPRWTLPLAVVWTGWRLITLIFPAARFTFAAPQPHAAFPFVSLVFWFLLWLAWIGTALYAQIDRYRRVSTPAQRQQTKWAMIGAAAAVAGYVAFVLPRLVIPWLGQPGLPNLLYSALGLPLYLVTLLLVPMCIAFSILRYRLWDVDVLVNRALVYGALTAALALVYFGSVLLLQFLFRTLTGQDSPVAIVASTLAIAALFEPLRQRLQTAINRRFYRSRYDVAQTLATFGAALRSEVDLAQLSERLLVMVQETMQPAHVSLWLRPPQRTTDNARRDTAL